MKLFKNTQQAVDLAFFITLATFTAIATLTVGSALLGLIVK